MQMPCRIDHPDIYKGHLEITLSGALACTRPPWHGSSLAPFVCGGAQRGISLATGTFTGESTQIHLPWTANSKCINISILGNHDRGLLDSFTKSTKSSLPNPLGQIHLTKSSRPNGGKTGKCPDIDRFFAPGGIGAWPLERPT